MKAELFMEIKTIHGDNVVINKQGISYIQKFDETTVICMRENFSKVASFETKMDFVILVQMLIPFEVEIRQ